MCLCVGGEGGRGAEPERGSECKQISQHDLSLPQSFDLMQIASEEWLIVMLVYFLLGRCAHTYRYDNLGQRSAED